MTPYGATEALPICVVDSGEILTDDVREKTATGAGVLVGTPVDEAKVSIIRITDDPIEQMNDSLLAARGEVGEILVEGKMVTSSYHGPA